MREKAIEYLNTRSTKLPNGCIEWNRLARDGFGHINGTKIAIYFKVNYVHQLSYVLYIGERDLNFVLRHSCKNKGCVNPDHIYQSTKESVGFKVKGYIEPYRYYRKGKYIFYSKLTKQRIILNRKEHIVENGKVFHIAYIPPFYEMVKTELVTVGVLREGEILV